MARCRKDSFVGAPPEISFPSAPRREREPGSRSPDDELVGVISQPSSTLTLILPEVPAVSPRSKIDLPYCAILSRVWDSFMPAPRRLCGRTHGCRNYLT